MSVSFVTLLARLRRESESPSGGSDPELLNRFAHQHDQEAFTALVARHGPMVLGACRRVLGDTHAAEDAFQATFLVLARRAGSLRRPDRVAGWLYGVAARVAREARRGRARRPRVGVAEQTDPADPRPDALADLTARELLTVLEEEVQRLPCAHRLPVVLCCLEGLSQEEAAGRLGWSPGQLKGRLERGRKALHNRLVRRGLSLSAALGVGEAGGPVSAALTGSTVRTASAFGPGRVSALDPAAGAVPLAEGVLRVIRVAELKTLAVVLCFTVAVGAALLVAGSLAAGQPDGDDRGGGPGEMALTPKPAGPAAGDLAAELEEFQGLWQDHNGGVEHRDGEETVRQPEPNGPCFFVRGNRLIWLTGDGRPNGREERITVDVNATPKRIALTPVLIDGTPVAARPTYGIFELTQAGPRIQLGLDGGPAPAHFLEETKPVVGVDGREWLIGRKRLDGLKPSEGR